MTGRHCYHGNKRAYYLGVGRYWIRVPREIWFRVRLTGQIRYGNEGQPLMFRASR